MKKLLTPIKNKLSLLVIIILATAVGGLATSLVQAAIPDSNGVIHGCRLNSDGSVRIIDSSSDSCTGSETSLNWDQHAAQGTKYGDYIPSAFANTDIQGTDLTFRNLPGTDFTNTSIESSANFSHANLSNSNFTGGTLHLTSDHLNLSGSTFSGADTAGLNLSYSNLSSTDFSDTTVTSASFGFSDFSHADFTNASLADSSFSDATGFDTATLTGTTWSNVYCPDATNSDNNGNTCIGHLSP